MRSSIKNTFLLIFTALTIVFTQTALAESQSIKPTKYVSKDAHFSISFPTTYSVRKNDTDKNKTFTIGAAKDAIFYELKYGIQESPLPETMTSTFLERVKEQYISKGKIDSEKDITIKGQPGKEIKFLTEQGGAKIFNYMRILVKDNVWYTIKVFSNEKYPDQEMVNRYFDSFQFSS